MDAEILINQSEMVKNIPVGFDIDLVICTTMSIDPSVMIQTIFQIGYPGLSKVKKSQVDVVLGCEKKFRFFYDVKESINFANDSCIVGTLSDNSIVALNNMAFHVTHKGPIFHPKIILIRFKSLKGDSYYRFMVSSKNLTSLNPYEVGVILESEKCDQGNPNHNLSDFLNFILKGKDDEKIKSIAEEIKNYQFVLLNEGCQDRDVKIKFSGCLDNLGMQYSLFKHLKEKKDDMLVLSPPYETKQKIIKKYFVYEPKLEETHAKLYYLTGSETILWVGSSNLSKGGMWKNVECMVEIHKAEGITKHDSDNITVFGTPCVRVRKATIIEHNDAIEKLNTFIQDHDFKSDAKKIYITDNYTYEYVGCRFWVKVYDWNPTNEDVWTEIDYKKTNIELERKGNSDFLLIRCEYDNKEKNKIQVAKKMISLKTTDDEDVLKGALTKSYKELLEEPWFNYAQKNDTAMREYGIRVGHELINNNAITDEQKSEIRILLDLIEHYYQKET